MVPTVMAGLVPAIRLQSDVVGCIGDYLDDRAVASRW